MDDKIIGHIDMDAFFASVEERDKPWLKGLPVVVGSDPKGGLGRGVVATANYLARTYGIRSALPIQKAWKYSEAARLRGEKGAVFITPHGRRYGDISREVFSIVEKHVDALQVTSIDEAYFDMGSISSYEVAHTFCKKLKEDIKTQTKLTCSIGLGPNKMVAKIASNVNKPDGLTLVREEEVSDFLAPLSVRTVPGIGPKTETQLRNMGIETIEDMRAYSWESMYEEFGSHGFSLYQKARGVGSTDLLSTHERKSIGKHETFVEDVYNLDFVSCALERMANDIIHQIFKKGFTGFRTTVLTVRFADFETKSRSLTTKETVSDKKHLHIRALKLLLPFFDASENPTHKAIRMVGLRAEKLM